MMSSILRVLLMGVFISLSGCALGSEPAPGHVAREEGFVDITLPIAEHRWESDGSLTVVARGRVNGEAVGFTVALAPEWTPQRSEGVPITVYWGKGQIRSVGSESDSFLALLAQEYGLPARPTMAPRVETTLVALGSDPRELRSIPAKIKVFFEAGGEESYGEAFINIDLAGKVLEFRDKDPEYHQGILSSLGGQS